MAVVGDYGADPDALLEWLSSGSEEMRDMQTMALEHLCMALLMSDNVDRCFETYPPKTFIPPLCMIFLDATAPDSILEATARALTYYLDVSAECTRRIMSVEGTVRAICNRLMFASLDSQTGKDLAEQCIKVLEHISSRDVSGLVEAGALNAVLTFIETYGKSLHKDALRSAMGIVTRLCTKIEPSDESVSGIVESLTALLKHSDAQVADSALKCFSALAERFARRNGNAEILSRHGLVDVLLQRLENVPRTSMSLTRVSTSASESFSSAISVLSLLHNLVRESDAVCTALANSPSLSKAALIVLESDDRCISELTRMMEALLVVLLEGRHALPKSLGSCSDRGGFRRFENDRSNRHLIEIIRNRDFDGLVDAVENGSVDVNLVDDVGQSLLNWYVGWPRPGLVDRPVVDVVTNTVAVFVTTTTTGRSTRPGRGHPTGTCAAFGTLEMVEFLCERGADVNKGQRSSSLHYAACFGRVGILKVLLQYGADAALKDEDGKTALEKAQERNEEGHSEIVKLLTEPQNWTPPPPKFVRKERLVLNTASEKKGLDVDKGTELALIMLPLFIQVVSTTMSSVVRRSAAMLVQKMVTWIPVEKFRVSGEDFQNAIVKMLSVLMSSEDDESFSMALDTVDLLATKFGIEFLNSMYCAGIVSQIGGKATEEKQRLAAETGRSSPSIDVDSVRVQKFGEWYILKGSASLCLWSDFIVVELPNSSSGWFQTFINGKVSTVRTAKDSIYSDLHSEGLYLSSTTTESQSGSLKKLLDTVQDLRSDETFSFTTFIGTEATRFGDWVFTCMEGRILRINNTESTSEIQIRHNLTDTVVVSKAGDNSRSLVALTKVLSGSGQEGGLTLGSTERHKEQASKRRTQKLALQLYSKYFENARHNPRRPLGRLMDAIARLEESVVQQKQQQIQHLRGEKLWSDEFKGGVRDLMMSIGDGNILSAYEILSTDLVKVLITVFGADDMSPHDLSMRSQRIELWKSIFKAEASRSGDQPASQTLVRTLVKMLEASEKLPVYVADSTLPGGGFQALTRSVVLKLEMRESSTQLMDRSGKKIRVEPLVTVREMDEFLWKKLFKKWHDHERSQLNFVKKLRENDARLSFPYVSDFDDNGILYWVGTNGKSPGVEWINPVSAGLMAITSCDSRLLPCGSVSDLVSRSPIPMYVRTADTKEPWFAIDTGLMVEPSHYTLRHGRGSGALRNWLLQASKDAVTWQTLRSHANDNSLSAVGSTSTWPISDTLTSTSWRYFRVQMLGENSEFESCMCISGFELYGVVSGVFDDVGKAFKDSPIKRLRGSGREVNVDVSRLEPPPQSSAASRVTESRSAIQHRVSDSTLSLPETSGFGLPFGSHAAEQAVSTGHLHRPIEAQPTGILRAMPTSNLSRFGSETAQFWQLTSTAEREMSEEPAPSGRLSSSRVSESNGSVSQDADLPISSTSSDFASTSQLTHDLSSLQSEQSTPVGSTLSLSESVDYNTAALNQLSLSAPNLASHSNSSGSESSSRFSHLRLLGRGLRTAFSNLQPTRPEPTLMVPEETESSSSLSGAQSFPTLTQQEVLLDPLRFAPNSRTRAFLAALRSIATDDTSSSSNNVHLDLREALDLTFRDDDAEGRESDAFVTLADFAYRTLQGSRASRDSEMTEEGSSEDEPQEPRHKSSAWNDDYVLKRQFASLIPNFDPRPGRNNVSQTTEVDVDTPARSELGNLFENSKRKEELKVSLSLRMSGTSQGEVYPLSPDENILSLMQRLLMVCDVDPKQARSRKNWDSSISLVYGDKNLLSTSESRSSNSSASVVYPSCNPTNPEVVADILHVLRNFVDIASPPKGDYPLVPGNDSLTSCFAVEPADFHSGKIASKMLTHLNNYTAVAADPTALPPWCDSLMADYSFVLPYDTRRSCFASTAFGCERTIVWLQNLREQQQEGSRSGRLEALLHNFRLGRMLHLRIRKVSRHHILDSAMAALFRHGHSKSVLEIEFENEEGTGLGPTLEFFSLIAAELQRKDLAMWICDDQQIPSRTDMVDLGSGWKFPGFYVNSPGGLFPAPYPPEHPGLAQLKNLYRLLGICVGKALIDDRLLDLPLSPSFFKMICTDGRRAVLDGSHHSLSAVASDPLFTSVMDSSSKKNRRQQRRNKKTSLRAIYRPSTAPWFGVLGLEHLEQIDPHRGRFIRGLLSLIKKRQLISDDLMLNEDQKREKLRTLSFEFANGNRTEFIRLDDLGLTFEFNPASKVFNYLSCDLIAEGDTIPVTIENVDLYVDLTLDFCFNSGIRVQMDAFREGLEQVLPLEKLRLFTPEELRTHLCGDQAPTWTRSDIMQFTEPKLGYTQESPTFKRFVNVLVNLTPDERKAFVYFITGSSSLPPGGLGNLFPRLTVVKKISTTENEGYPSVNTCVHFLKLPEYSSEQILYERLMAATRERGFYYN